MRLLGLFQFLRFVLGLPRTLQDIYIYQCQISTDPS